MMVEKATNTIAAGAVSSPVWLPILSDISQVAALVLPILGVLWFVFQFYWRISGRDKK